MSIWLGNQRLDGNAGRNVGDIFYTTRLDSGLGGAVECNGGTYSTADYTGSGSIGELLASGKLPYVSLTDYATAISTKGWCDKIGWDGTGTTTVRVPTLTSHIIQTNNIPVVGNGYGLTLTNGSQTLGLAHDSANVQTPIGATNMPYTTIGTATTRNNTQQATTLGIPTSDMIGEDLSKSGIIADTTDTAQLRVMFQLFDSTTDEAVATVGTITAQVGENTTQISDLRNMSNITATGKETVVGWGIPDYSAGVSIAFPLQASPYTAPANGFVAFAFKYSNATGDLYINGNVVANKQSSGSNRDNDSMMFPVAKNDVLYWTRQYNGSELFVCKFFPSKQ